MSEIMDRQVSLPYHGADRGTSDSIRAIASLLQASEIERALLVTSPADSDGNRSHGFFLWTTPEGYVVVMPGFSSGYGGEGPTGLSLTLAGLRAHDVELGELQVDGQFFGRFRRGLLTAEDLDVLIDGRRIRNGYPYDYIMEHHRERGEASALIWREASIPMPFGLIDPRLFDLAKSFRTDPDRSLVSAYRRIEDIVRSRTGLEEFGSKLMSAAFLGKSPPLTWNGMATAEVQGRAQRFVSAFMAYRNPRAHKEPEFGESERELFREFLAANELFVLEASSVDANVQTEREK
ncbi:MAG: hypothetical protein GXP55_21430 [Deltaproteobacteria bacterium]|nr:hypothetical protein [Deltaproteobacteria bacterium]